MKHDASAVSREQKRSVALDHTRTYVLSRALRCLRLETPGTYARIAPRSGLAAKKMINCGAGVVDYDYRGEAPAAPEHTLLKPTPLFWPRTQFPSFFKSETPLLADQLVENT